MKRITLRDLLNLEDNELDNYKIGLEIHDENGTFYEQWKNNLLNYNNLYFNKNLNNKAWPMGLKTGKKVLVFIQLPNDNHKWLLISAGQCKNSIIKNNCEFFEYEEIDKYKGFVERLIINVTKVGWDKHRPINDLKTFIDTAEVIEILPKNYEAIEFNGYENVQLSYNDLRLVLDTNRFENYKNMLRNIKGIYCITDKNTNKFYIGSAYGKDGVAQRWEYYKEIKHGGNEELIKLYNKEGEEYFKQNMFFTLLEYFDKNKYKDVNDIIKRESYWKYTFQTKENGYNKN